MDEPKGYFASQKPEETADVLLARAVFWNRTLEDNGYLDKLRILWAAYNGVGFADLASSHQITFGGEQGELSQMVVNHLRNLGQHMLIMTTSNRPSLEARATNTDYKSLVQTNLANGLLDYYMREKRLEKYFKTAVETAIVLGAGYVKLEWNSTSGEIFDYNEDTGYPIYQGDVQFSNISPFDIYFDPTKENQKHDYYLVRNWKNRFDLIAKYPEHEEAIMALPNKAEIDGVGISTFAYNETDDVAVWEFFHDRTESMPNGRYMLFVSPEAVLLDTSLPYRELPIYRIAASDFLGTPFGYSPLFDLLPIQEGINMLYSTVLTNQSNFGVQNIWVPNTGDINVTALGGGLNIISGNPQGGPPTPLNLTNTPAEIFKFIEMLEQVSETLSGISSVTRGNPEASLKSGSALALVQSMSLQFMSGLQQQYVALIEDVGTGLINMLKDFAAVPRIAAIVGKNNRTYMREFKGEDLEGINRVIVDMGNPLARTTAGRVQMAEQMLQMNLIKTPEQYMMVINTGKLDVMTENTTSQLLLTKGENEAMVAGKRVLVLATDAHKMHIEEHSSILADPHLRTDPNLTSLVLEHIQEHINALRSTDPDLLGLLGQQALAPIGGTPASPQPPGGDMGSAPQNASMLEQPGMPQPPNMPNMPQVDQGLLPNPQAVPPAPVEPQGLPNG